MKRLFLAAASLSFGLVAGAPAFAAPAPQSGVYAIEPTHTQVVFSVLHFGFTTYTGLFSNVSGTLHLNAATPAESSLNVTIPVSSVQTTSDVLTGELKADDWFDAAKYPDATFVSTSVRQTDPHDAIVTGTLTIRGISKPETLAVHFIGAGVNPMDKKFTVGFEATGTIKRSDFGVSKYVPYVSDAVELHIAGAFEKQG
ncbi:YceI family protein [Acidomonas methanolica]|uniref:Lipid/polyisoprenoid-binding YceI-like domain-containing protein n=1 Tax=Acidomonas methanolica NBRC 104435 TaxID=1231351 RepID=A0A023D2I5_ACIMT|nr:YceI family protein [Acidomonas methanolica]MBU2654180.1 YceI family protein [Acidomonas methanolica]TCS30590.1 polyisoprenoid-binding protein YceI [Acidomonas methanolica]GAJ28368.1 hypothetical protein Amme_020_037 [Acidomonas methanolica NBRC 104435]GBQ46338.1 hypothetical protein AA0498_0265 [Acidomonas methanolica]GEK98852.1 hypothetical protein AME01nite_13510 [Acidomonas methanolica NBRC 104435]